MKWRLRLAIPLVILLIGAVSVQIYAHIAAAAQPANSRPAHAVNFPTRQKVHAVAKAANVQGTGDLTYSGGPVQAAPVAYVIFWGSNWTGPDSAAANVVQSYFNDMGHTRFENTLSQYYSSSGGVNTYVAPQLTYGGAWFDTSTTPAPDTTCAGKTTIDDSAIQAEVDAMISAGHFPKDTTNAAYFVYTPAGDYVNDGSGSCSELQFCAYHSLSSSGVSYAAMAYPIDMTSCGVTTQPNGSAVGDSLANITSHEQFESITDPNTTNGWMDSSGYEIGDKCAWDFSGGTTALNNGGSFELQTEYSNSSHSCVNAFVDSISTNPSSLALTTPAGSNPPSQTITVTDNSGAPYSWQASVSSGATWLSVSSTSGTVNPHSGAPLTVTFNLPGNASGTYTATITLTDQGPPAPGFVAPISIPVTVVVSNISKIWYFAEGHTGDSFTEYLTLENPNNVAANVQVKYLLGGGSPITKNYVVNANSRSTLKVNNEIGAPQNVSMVVTSDQPIIAERPMYFSYNGLPGYIIPGGTDVLGATQLGSSFDFGYLDVSKGHDTWLTVLNQNSYTVQVNVRYFAASTGAEIDRSHLVAANTRGTVHVNVEGLPAGSYSALVSLVQSGTTTAAPGLVERPMYLVDSVTGYYGSADVVGVTQPQTTSYFAEGYTGPSFSERYILSNPGATSTSATVTFLLSNGSTRTYTVNIGPGQQQMVNAASVIGGSQNNSAVVTSSGGGILAERFMSFNYTGPVGSGSGVSGGVQGASDVLGASQPASLYEFAEGYSGGQFGEWVTLENPSTSQSAQVTVRYLPQSGAAPTVQSYTIAPNSRFTIFANRVMPNQSFSMEMLSSAPIVAERPMYFSFNVGNGPQNGGTDVIGYAP